MELNPGLSWSRIFYAFACLAPQGRLDEALAEMQRALELNPLSLQHNTSICRLPLLSAQV